MRAGTAPRVEPEVVRPRDVEGQLVVARRPAPHEDALARGAVEGAVRRGRGLRGWALSTARAGGGRDREVARGRRAGLLLQRLDGLRRRGPREARADLRKPRLRGLRLGEPLLRDRRALLET